MNPEIVHEPGEVFGRWTVLRRVAAARLMCRCECGVERVVFSYLLRSGRSRSCGCLAAEASSARATTHGLIDTPEYRSWSAMKARCYRTTDPFFADYGGRGIAVCDRWRDSFENFRADMGTRPDGTTIDRIDNDRGYEPGNCRWATAVEQHNNKRNNHLITLDGETLSLTAWARRLGIDRGTVQARLRRGWDVVRSLREPVDATHSPRRRSSP